MKRYLIDVVFKNKIIQFDEESETIIKGSGYFLEENDTKTIYFKDKNKEYKYVLEDNQVTIFNEQSTLKFKLNTKIQFDYLVDNQKITLFSYTNKMKLTEQSFVLHYELYNQEVLIGQYFLNLTINKKH